MAAAKQDIYIEQGATCPVSFRLKKNGNAIDLTGWTFKGRVRKSPEENAVEAAFDFVVRDQEVPADLGIVDGEITPENTAAIHVLKSNVPGAREITKMIYDIYAVSPSGRSYRILEGAANVSPEVTK